jgi:L-asparaginase II
MKPFQALPFMMHEGDKAFNFTEQEIAIMCASHSGTEKHTAVIDGMHQKIGTSEADLACGVHWPTDLPTREAMKFAGRTPNQFHHNCSGKHTGMLAYARLKNWEIRNYLDPQHPVQVSIRETLAEMVDLKPGEMPLGIDGCSAPVYGIPLQNMAHGVALLADPVSHEPKRAQACQKITSAMMAHPDMVAGPDEFDTDLMRACAGKVFSKAGAEGYQIIGVIPGVLEENSPGLGIAVKISDGDLRDRARPFLILHILSALGVLHAEAGDALSKYWQEPVKNWRGNPVGEFRLVSSILDQDSGA